MIYIPAWSVRDILSISIQSFCKWIRNTHLQVHSKELTGYEVIFIPYKISREAPGQ